MARVMFYADVPPEVAERLSMIREVDAMAVGLPGGLRLVVATDAVVLGQAAQAVDRHLIGGPGADEAIRWLGIAARRATHDQTCRYTQGDHDGH